MKDLTGSGRSVLQVLEGTRMLRGGQPVWLGASVGLESSVTL